MAEETKDVEVNIQLKGVVTDGVVRVDLGPLAAIFGNSCAGKPDGTSCGPGCECRAGQPVLTLGMHGLRGLAPGINVKVVDPKE